MMFFQSIQGVLTILSIIVLGYVLERNGWFGAGFSQSVSSLITKIALPASVFVSVLNTLTWDKLLSLSGSLIYPFGGVAVSYLIAVLLVRIIKVRPGRRGVFINTIVNANTIFIGLPLNIALFGESAMPYFLLYYITNTVSTWGVGIFFIQADDPEKTKGTKTRKFNWRSLVPPPLAGFVVALVFLAFEIPVPGFAKSALTYVGNIVTPLALIYIGIVLCDAGLSSISFDRDTVVALLGRFIASPVVLILLIGIGAGLGHSLNETLKQTLIVQSAAPALTVLPILAEASHGDVKYATNVVVTSTLLFVAVVPVLMTLLQYF